MAYQSSSSTLSFSLGGRDELVLPPLLRHPANEDRVSCIVNSPAVRSPSAHRETTCCQKSVGKRWARFTCTRPSSPWWGTRWRRSRPPPSNPSRGVVPSGVVPAPLEIDWSALNPTAREIAQQFGIRPRRLLRLTEPGRCWFALDQRAIVALTRLWRGIGRSPPRAAVSPATRHNGPPSSVPRRARIATPLGSSG